MSEFARMNGYNFLNRSFDTNFQDDRYTSMIPEPIRLKYLEAMGIEVWYSRSRLSQSDLSGAVGDLDVEEASVGNESESPSMRATPEATLPQQVDVPDPVPGSGGQLSSGPLSEFILHMAQYPGCLLVFDSSEPQTKLPGAYQRLLNDLAFSIGKANTLAQLSQLNWSPTSFGDPSQMVQKRVSELMANSDSCLIVMGEAARRLLFGEQPSTSMMTSFQGKPAITVMGIDQLFEDPISKRLLWSRLHEIVPVT